MKAKRVTNLLAIAVLLFSSSGSAKATTTAVTAENLQSLQPVSQTIQQGGTGGQPLDNLYIKDQSGRQDDPDKYVTYTTPDEKFDGIREYLLPDYIPLEAITSLKMKVNYRGPLVSKQTWTWMAYSWTKNAWVKIGDNGSVTANTWTLLTFALRTPQQFVNGDRQIRILMKSNNASRDAKLDYESIRVIYPCSAQNNSYATTCAEEDNINVPIFASRISQFKVIVTHPQYDIGDDNCAADFSGCNAIMGSTARAADLCDTLADNTITVIKGCHVSSWWRPYKMQIIVGGANGEYDYLVINRKIQDQPNPEPSWPEFLVLYEDGNLRLKPHPPLGRMDTCFGSSVIIGPAVDLDTVRPYADIESAQVQLSPLTLDLTYRNGGTAHLALSVNRSKAVATVTVHYPTSPTIPFAVFRSMYVSDGNADVDHLMSSQGDFPIIDGWSHLEGLWWFFHRTVRSNHNTSAPDIRIQVVK